MSAITLSDAQAILNKLIEVQKNDPIGAIGSVTVAGRTVSYKSTDDLIKMINYWTGVVSDLSRSRDGASTFGRSAAVFVR